MPVDVQARGEASAAARLGMPVNDYRALRALGYRWCSWQHHRRWHTVDKFSAATLRGSRSYCIEADRALSRERSRSYRERKHTQEGRQP